MPLSNDYFSWVHLQSKGTEVFIEILLHSESNDKRSGDTPKVLISL